MFKCDPIGIKFSTKVNVFIYIKIKISLLLFRKDICMGSMRINEPIEMKFDT